MPALHPPAAHTPALARELPPSTQQQHARPALLACVHQAPPSATLPGRRCSASAAAGGRTAGAALRQLTGSPASAQTFCRQRSRAAGGRVPVRAAAPACSPACAYVCACALRSNLAKTWFGYELQRRHPQLTVPLCHPGVCVVCAPGCHALQLLPVQPQPAESARCAAARRTRCIACCTRLGACFHSHGQHRRD